MSYTPPNVITQTLGPGVHKVFLDALTEITDPGKLAKFQAQAVFVATYKSVDTAYTIDHIIKFSGAKADFYAGQNIDRLHLAAGLPEPIPGSPLDLTTLLISISGKEFLIEVNDKGYAQTVLVPSDGTAPGEEAPF